MKSIRILIPWTIVVLLAIVAIFQFRATLRWRTVADDAANSNAAAASDLAKLNADYQALNKEMERIRAEQADLETTASSQRDHIAELEMKLADAATVATATDAPPAEEAHAQAVSRRAVESPDPEMERDMAEQSANMRLELRYGAWLRELGLDPEREEALRSTLQRILAAEEETRMRGESPLSDAEYLAQLRDGLSGVLSAEEMAAFDEYQAGLPERMLRQDFASEVSDFAPGLSDTTRAALVDVLVEEALLADATPTPEGATAAYPLQERMDVYANAADRFAGTLNATEAAALNRFLDQRQSQLGTTVQMIERTEAQGGHASVDMRDGQTQVRIERTDTRPASGNQKSDEKAVQSD